jgi:hypothetical protein
VSTLSPHTLRGLRVPPDLQTLREVVEQHHCHCFVDTDGVTRDAERMLQLMDTWRPNRSDGRAGIKRNHAFNPALPVIVSSGDRISYALDVIVPGEPSLLFSIVQPDVSSGPPSQGRSRE